MSRPFLNLKVAARASTIQLSDRLELRVHRYSQCFLSSHEDPSADHPATPELRIGIPHTLTDTLRPTTFIQLPLSQPFTMEPQFPLPNASACQRCGQSCTRQIVSAGNRNGNSGRPYYTCIYGGHPRTFSTWDDNQGIVNGNPRCWCGFTSRRVTTNGPTPTDFYSCPVGRCRYSEGAPLAPEANSIAVVGVPPQYVEPLPRVDIEAQAVRMRPAYRERRHYCCVVM